MLPDARARIEALGFAPSDVDTLLAHFEDAEQRGKLGHGHSRIPWLETLDGYDPVASPELVVDDPGYQRWHSRGAIGYLVLSAVVAAQIERPPTHARLV